MKKTGKKCGIIFFVGIFSLFSSLTMCDLTEAGSKSNRKWIKAGNTIYTVLDETKKKTSGKGTSLKIKDIPCVSQQSFTLPIIESKDGYDRVYMPGLEQWTGTTGAPILPFKTIRLLVPYGQKASKVRITLGRPRVLEGNYVIEREFDITFNCLDDDQLLCPVYVEKYPKNQ